MYSTSKDRSSYQFINVTVVIPFFKYTKPPLPPLPAANRVKKKKKKRKKIGRYLHVKILLYMALHLHLQLPRPTYYLHEIGLPTYWPGPSGFVKDCCLFLTGIAFVDI